MKMRNEVSFDHVIPVSGSVSGFLIGLLGSLGKLPVRLGSHFSGHSPKLTFKISGSWHDLIKSLGLLTFEDAIRNLVNLLLSNLTFVFVCWEGCCQDYLGCYPRTSLT